MKKKCNVFLFFCKVPESSWVRFKLLSILHRITQLIDLVDKDDEDFKYEYDFGDGWDHLITLEKYELLDNTQQLPFCISGALKCPLEDCG